MRAAARNSVGPPGPAACPLRQVRYPRLCFRSPSSGRGATRSSRLDRELGTEQATQSDARCTAAVSRPSRTGPADPRRFRFDISATVALGCLPAFIYLAGRWGNRQTPASPEVAGESAGRPSTEEEQQMTHQFDGARGASVVRDRGERAQRANASAAPKLPSARKACIQDGLSLAPNCRIQDSFSSAREACFHPPLASRQGQRGSSMSPVPFRVRTQAPTCALHTRSREVPRMR